MMRWMLLLTAIIFFQGCGKKGFFGGGGTSGGTKTVKKIDRGISDSEMKEGLADEEEPSDDDSEGPEEKVDDMTLTTEQRLFDPKIGAEVARPDSPSSTVTKNVSIGDTRTVNLNMDLNVWGVGKSSNVSTDVNVDYSSSFSVYKHTPKGAPGVLSAEGKLIYDPENRPVADCTYDVSITSGASSMGTISVNPKIPFVGTGGGTSVDFGKTLSDSGTISVSSNTFILRPDEGIDAIAKLCEEAFEKEFKKSIDDQLAAMVKTNFVMDQRESFKTVVALAKSGTSSLIEDIHGIDFTVDKTKALFKDGRKVVTGGLGAIKKAGATGAGKAAVKTGGKAVDGAKGAGNAAVDGAKGAGKAIGGAIGGLFLAAEDPGLRFCYRYELNNTNEILSEQYNDCQGNSVSLDSDVGTRAKEVAQEIGMTMAQGIRTPASTSTP